MYKYLLVEIKGVSPLLMHNPQTADPRNQYAREMRSITDKKKNKTDEDLERLSDLEWEAGLYLNDKQQPIIPGEMIEAMMIAAGKKKSQGPKFKAGMMCDGSWPVTYTGPKNIAKLKKDTNFRLSVFAVISRSRILRTRPMFRDWSVEFVLSYLPEVLDETIIRHALKDCLLLGLGDWRPKYGRFVVTKIEPCKG